MNENERSRSGWPFRQYSDLTEEERAAQATDMENDRLAREERDAKRRETKRLRRNWPPVERRPKCLCGCGKRLSPSFISIEERIETSTGFYHNSVETDVMRFWEGVGNVFATNTCAIRFALSTAAAREAKKWNTEAVAIFNDERKAGRR